MTPNLQNDSYDYCIDDNDDDDDDILTTVLIDSIHEALSGSNWACLPGYYANHHI